ncbi:MAG: tRNA (adenosine(37)-N6)-threonylcarbamoyltransferase complex transferase subunit TsaD [Christensenellaceae bacterium]|jgi:N6-L-threonylcarbamoyladenine synthase|nr:tRNA (adenosine(37)-N6)-threonylcarbamoyltransferase complex transferase subunit TsaD [Christensenellaceae bacterium]
MRPVLAIESSCDETAAAVVCGREIVSSVVFSQVSTHALYGGVVPEIASRAHVEALPEVVGQALARASLRPSDLLGVGVTNGPGLVGALLCGVSYAKGFAYANRLPIAGVQHIEGHICANFLSHKELEPPFIALVVSGGHSHIIELEDYGAHRVLGKTRDDAAGEAFDKAARVLGLPYPGGPSIDDLAECGDAYALPLPRPRVEGLNYSFSGLKTALLQAVARAEKQGITLKKEDIAASFRRAVVEQLLQKAEEALLETGHRKLVLAGGVACNLLLRREAQGLCERLGAQLYMPPPALCADNAAMIAFAASYRLERGERSGLDLNAIPSRALPEA